MGALVNAIAQRWRAQEDDLCGGWCVTLEGDQRSPAEGARPIAFFCEKEEAKHIARLHNEWLENGGKV